MYRVTLNKSEEKKHLGFSCYELEEGIVIEVDNEWHFIDHLPTVDEINELPELGNATMDEAGDEVVITVFDEE